MGFTLSSPAFSDGADIPLVHTCDGEDRSPPLCWDDPPSGTQSFVLMMEDRDAPGGPFLHWLLFGIPAALRELETATPVGTPGLNHFSRSGYGGPCPKEGEPPHRYVFTLLALDFARLDLPPDSARRDVDALIAGHVLGRAVLSGRFARAARAARAGAC